MATWETAQICPYCEAGCGVLTKVTDGVVVRVRGDSDDPASRGFLCPKASGLKWLHEDPDRIRNPMMRHGGEWSEVNWEEAFAFTTERVLGVLQRNGKDSLAYYAGNPTAHDLSWIVYGRYIAAATRLRFSPATVDSLPRQLATGYLYGGEFTMPVPDLDRTHLLWIIGANPVVSNGSLVTAPDFKGRLQRIQGRGGRVVVFDPRRTETAQLADEHHFIRPGTDAFFLAAVARSLIEENLISLGHLNLVVKNVLGLEAALRPFEADMVAAKCGIGPELIRGLARQLAAAQSSVVYGRVGTCTQEFGTVTSFLIETLNILTGNLDRPGGSMFPLPVAGSEVTRPGGPRPPRIGRWRTRVRNLPEVMGELPAVCLAEEIEGSGGDRIRALVTFAGNPVMSVPGTARLTRALGGLDFMASVDLYLNETTRHAHVIFPGESHVQRPHFPMGFQRYAVQQVAKWSDPALPPDPSRPRDWEIYLRLAQIMAGTDSAKTPSEIDSELFMRRVSADVADSRSSVFGVDPTIILDQCSEPGPRRWAEYRVRTGPYGDQFGRVSDGLTLRKIQQHPHGLEMEQMQPRLSEIIRTVDSKIDLASAPLLSELRRLAEAPGRSDGLLLIGRRSLRSNNSWMHNLDGLVRGRIRHTCLIHPLDAGRLDLVDGGTAFVSSEEGEIEVTVAVSDDVMQGVVSLPHGWGAGGPGVQLRVAVAAGGANSNEIASPELLDLPSGTAVVNGYPVMVRAGRSSAS